MIAMIWLAVAISVIPLIVLILQCFVPRWTGFIPNQWTFRGIETFIKNFGSIVDLSILTIKLGLIVAVLSTLIAMLIGRYYVNKQIKHHLLWELFVMLPVFVPTTVCALGMRNVFFDLNLANSYASVVIALCVVNVPYSAKILIDVNSAIGVKYEQQASMLGAGPIKSYFLSTFRLLLPGIYSSLGVVFMNAINDYFLIAMMGSGKIKSLITTLVLPAVQSSTPPVASVYCVFFIALDAFFFFVFQMMSKAALNKVGKNIGE
jgi:putative spermidine/putrescine transport system permease protein